jgi:hypothetical protein
VNPSSIPLETGPQASAPDDLRGLFHQLSNQLGIILANAELLELKLADPTQKARATLVVSAAVDAMSTTRSIRSVSGV